MKIYLNVFLCCCFHWVLGVGPRDTWGGKALGDGETHMWMPHPTSDLNWPWEAVVCKGSSTHTGTRVDLCEQAGHLRQDLLFLLSDCYKGNYSPCPFTSSWKPSNSHSYSTPGWMSLFELSLHQHYRCPPELAQGSVYITAATQDCGTLTVGLFPLCITGSSMQSTFQTLNKFIWNE